jgi:DNA-binding transcriptional MocR family regulator
MSAVLKHIAAVAKGLNKAELHVLIELVSRAESGGGHDAMASSRDLAEQTGLARSSVQLALDALHGKGLIDTNAGSATWALHRMFFLDAVEADVGGPNFKPEVARKSGWSGLKSGPLMAQIPGQSGSTARPGY